MKLIKHILGASIVAASSANAAVVFTDSFGYNTNTTAFTAGTALGDGGWTTVETTADGALGANGTHFWGNPLTGTSALEYNYTVTLNAGDVITMDSEVDRGTTYSYGMRIILWDGSTSGSRSEMEGGVFGGVGSEPANYDLPTVSYTVLQSDIDAGRNQLIFRQSNEGQWGETDSVSYTVTPNPAPEPSSTALLGLGGLALILRRKK